MATKFFKIILDPKADTLRIPPALKERTGRNLPNPVFLKVPGGATMEVEVNKCSNGEAMLQRGWREFRERYSLGYGHFLVFKCCKKSHDQFNVSIFDKSAVEIDYSENRGKTTQRSRHTRTRDDVIEISDDDDIYPVKKSLKRTTTPSHHFERKLKLEKNETTCEGNGTGMRFPKGVETQRAVVKEETSKAFGKAKSYASVNIKKNPFHVRLLGHSAVSHGCSLFVPLSFARESLPQNSANSVSMVTNGKSWVVRCLVRDMCARLSGGWMSFAKDNGLKIGDVCIFEVVKKSKTPTWNVIIFRS